MLNLTNMKEEIEKLMAQVNDLKCKTAKDVEEARVNLLGKKGEITKLFEEFREYAPEKKKEFGRRLNELKQAATAKIEEMRQQTSSEVTTAASSNDLSMPGTPYALGSRHPVSIVRQEIVDIFRKFGYDVAEGPEIEDDYHVFEALNFPPNHPARDMQDTFFVSTGHPNPILLRTHTSSVQVRTMESMKLPIRVICPGRVFRNEAISARAHCIFHQCEGLYIDEHVTFADLKQAILLFAREMFGPDTAIRMRPSYFPFTEPSSEVDVSCNICHGKGCNICKGTGWLEILGCGMVDPNVLEASGIDSKKYSGFAFGMGLERIAMLKWQVNDLRHYFENDFRFLSEFSTAVEV
jgi:phenylalanyl-tRNA synthetase alpha chain